MAFRLQLAANGLQRPPLAAQFAGAATDGVAFGCRTVSRRGTAEELVEVGALGKVAHQRADRRDAQLKAFGHHLGGVPFQKVGPTNLVVTLGGGRWLLEQGGEVGRTCQGSWGWWRQGGGCLRPSRQLS